MKKSKKIICIMMAAALSASAFTACGGTKVSSNDKREAIFISVFNGGYGREWLDDITRDFNAANRSDKYRIEVRASKDEFNKIYNEVLSGTALYDMFYSNAEIYKLIDQNKLENLNDVWDSTPEGSNESIREMMLDSEKYAKAYSDKDGNLYALPLQESIKGFVYSHTTFLKYGLLFDEDGQFTTDGTKLSKGKDGVAGTYDDGHPITEEQWRDMVTKARDQLGYAFIYNGKFTSYYNDLVDMLSAQYDGVDKWTIKYSLDGSYDFNEDGVESEDEKITIENGYRTGEMRGNLKALTWMDEYLACKDNVSGNPNGYVYPSSSMTSYAIGDAQDDFIIKLAKNSDEKAGMLVEGDWWENEAKATFNELAETSSKYADFAFRKHDFRMMTLPRMEGQKAKGNVYAIGENMYLTMKKQTNAEKLAVCKDFITFAYQPKYIQNYSVKTGGVMPYDVELTNEQENSLSSFAKSVRAIYEDRENNEFITPERNKNIYLTTRAGVNVGYAYGSGGYVVMDGLYTLSAQQYYNSYLQYRQTNWPTWKKAYEDYLKLRG